MCLYFGGLEPIIEENTNADMTGDLENKKSISEYVFIFTRELYHGNLNCKSVLLYLQLRESTQL